MTAVAFPFDMLHSRFVNEIYFSVKFPTDFRPNSSHV